MLTLNGFRGEYRYLSNFWGAPILHVDRVWPTSEHLFQAAKTDSLEEQEGIRFARTPAEAKQLGRTVIMRSDWLGMRVSVMAQIIKLKFDQHPTLRAKLKSTLQYADNELVEINTWGDTYWGVCNGKGTNHLGIVLMQYRETLK